MIDYEINNFRDLSLGNGDPVIVYSQRTGAQCLGTGFTSFEDVRYEIERRFEPESDESFDVFGIDGRIEFTEEKS